MLPKAPDSELRRDENPLIEALSNYQIIHVEAYVVHVDMISQNEVAFKLTTETIESLVEYHKDVFSVDAAAATWNWSEKDVQLKKLQREFVQAANKYIYRTSAVALEGLEEEGAGELLCGRSEEVREAIMGLFVPLLPPPPRVAEVIRPVPLLPSSAVPENWWPSQHIASQVSPSAEPWGLLPSSPSPVSSSDSHANMWSSVAIEEAHQLPSPSPSYGSPYSSPPYDALQYLSDVSPTSMPLPPLPLPSMLAQQHCSSTATAMGNIGWDRFTDYAMPFATAM